MVLQLDRCSDVVNTLYPDIDFLFLYEVFCWKWRPEWCRSLGCGIETVVYEWTKC